jgi:hypothetical protein
MRVFTTRVKRYNPHKRRIGALSIAIHERLKRLIHESAKYAMMQALLQSVIPQYTGMSIAQFLPLASKVKALTRVRALISPAHAPVQGYSRLHGGWSYRNVKGVSEGERLGQRAFNFTYGTPARPVFRFTFKIVVFQFWLHENAPSAAKARSSGPWGVLQIMEREFYYYVTKYWQDYIPDFPHWLVTGEIKN